VLVEMENNYGYGKGNSLDTICQLYVPIDLGRYPLPAAKKTQYGMPFKNELAEHIFDSIYQKSSENISQGSIDEIFEDRLTLIRSKIELIILQIEQRKKIHAKIFYRIAYDSCLVHNLLYDMGARIYGVDFDRISIEKMKLDLEEQKRREATNNFNDTSLLNRELREVLIEYKDEVQKSALVADMEARP